MEDFIEWAAFWIGYATPFVALVGFVFLIGWALYQYSNKPPKS